MKQNDKKRFYKHYLFTIIFVSTNKKIGVKRKGLGYFLREEIKNTKKKMFILNFQV